ncbi:MAG: transporter substrate-binding domain-containing protein [Kiritimatiellia bacterium]
MKVFTVLIFAALFSSGCRRDPDGPPPLVVGMELAYPPFEMTDERGSPRGVSVDMAEALAADLNRPLEIRNLAFDGLIPALKTGSIDLVISSMTATEERAKSIDFSDPYLFTGLAMLVARDSTVKSVADLNQAGRVVAVKLGTTGHVYATANLPLAEVRVLQKENACVL